MFTASKLKYYQQDPAWTSPNLNHATTILRSGHHLGDPAWTSPNLNHATTTLRSGHHLGVPSLYNLGECGANTVSPRSLCFVHGLPNSKAANQNGVNWLPTQAPTRIEYPSDTKCFLPHLIGLQSPPTDASSNSQKRFLICDKSGNQTRFFFSQGHPENEIVTPQKMLGSYGLHYDNLTAAVQKRSPVKPIGEDKLDGSYISVSVEESNTHEDTEEINALLYSSDGIEGDEDDDVYCEDDEVTSTDRSPCAHQAGCGEHVQHNVELTEEVDSYEGTCKRQRLPYGGYKKSSSVESGCANDESDDDNDDNDVESRCVTGSLPLSGKDKDSRLSTRKRKVKIRKTLKILESLIPGIKSKDPLLVIDEAINYLKSLRGKAESLGVGLPEEYPLTSC